MLLKLSGAIGCDCLEKHWLGYTSVLQLAVVRCLALHDTMIYWRVHKHLGDVVSLVC